MERSNYKDDKLDGPSIKWDKYGDPVERNMYKNGRKVARRKVEGTL